MSDAPGDIRSKMQAPRGTRDFYPPDMARRRRVTDAWRRVSERHGFDEVEGPTFEHLELYTIKSGEGIVSELFSFQDRGGRALALRPEFTPTLARMVVARAASLPRPIKWFAIPSHYRAERPQRGRLREFLQWNVDFLGDDSPEADVEVLAVAADFLSEMGLGPADVRIKVSHRQAVSRTLRSLGLAESQLDAAFALLDRRDKIEPEEFTRQAAALGLDADVVARFDEIARARVGASANWPEIVAALGASEDDLADLRRLHEALHTGGLADWCEYDLGIVRGLAYYTGMVFEIHEASGRERAIAGGGRYDRLVETFGGPSIPACGFGMGDVVLSLVLEDRGLLPPGEQILPRPDAFVVSAGPDEADRALLTVLLQLRREGLHARRSYKTTKNVGKLLKEASQSGARAAIILGQEIVDGLAVVKDLRTGEQRTVRLDNIAEALHHPPTET